MESVEIRQWRQIACLVIDILHYRSLTKDLKDKESDNYQMSFYDNVPSMVAFTEILAFEKWEIRSGFVQVLQIKGLLCI